MNTNVLTIVKKITVSAKKKKNIAAILQYVLLDGTKIVATDATCMFIVATEDQGEKRLIDLNNPLNVNFDPDSYAMYERIIPKYTDGIKISDSDINSLLATMYKSNVLFDYTYIELLMKTKAKYNNLEYFHDKENINRPVMAKGLIDGLDFIFVLMPFYQEA